MVGGIAAFAAWLGASTIVLADGRVGLAAGMAVSAAALAVVAWQSGTLVDAAFVLAGGLVAAALRWRNGPPGWNLMPPGSTSRLVLSIGAGLLTLWVAATVMQGPGISFRFAVMSSVALAAARLLATEDVAVATTAAGALLLAIAAGSLVEGASAGPEAIVVAAVIAAGAAGWPRRPAHAG